MSAKLYAVRNGRETGIFATWAECKAQVDGFSGAEFKSFKNRADAETYLNQNQAVADDGPSVEDDYISNSVDAYTDGGARDGRAAWGFVLIKGDSPVAQGSGLVSNPEVSAEANAAAELAAAMRAVRAAEELGATEVIIHHDYLGVANHVTGAWKAKSVGAKKYAEWMKKQNIRVRFVHVRGHSGNRWNDHADGLCTAELS